MHHPAEHCRYYCSMPDYLMMSGLHCFAKQSRWLLRCVHELPFPMHLLQFLLQFLLLLHQNVQPHLNCRRCSATHRFCHELLSVHSTKNCWLSHYAVGHSCDYCCWRNCCDDGGDGRCTTDNNGDSTDSSDGSTTDRNIHNSNPNKSKDNGGIHNTNNHCTNGDDNAMNKDSQKSNPRPNPKQGRPSHSSNGRNNRHGH